MTTRAYIFNSYDNRSTPAPITGALRRSAVKMYKYPQSVVTMTPQLFKHMQVFSLTNAATKCRTQDRLRPQAAEADTDSRSAWIGDVWSRDVLCLVWESGVRADKR